MRTGYQPPCPPILEEARFRGEAATRRAGHPFSSIFVLHCGILANMRWLFKEVFNMNRRNNIFIGTLLVLLGAIFLLKNLNIFDFYFDIFDVGFIISRFWPAFFLILPALAMHSIFFSGKTPDAGILVPGGILLTVGITCQLSMLFGIWGAMWPGFLLSVAVGLFEFYLFGTRDKALLIPVCILGGLSIVFFMSFSLSWALSFKARHLFVPIVLVALGILVMFKNNPRKRDF